MVPIGKKVMFRFLLLAISFTVCFVKLTNAEDHWVPELIQDFSTMTELDASVWHFELGYKRWNDEDEYYTNRSENLQVANGYLNITARHENYTGPDGHALYTSARIKTRSAFKYGKFEMVAQVPTGRGTWPAFWLLGNNSHAVSWPWCGELDIFESVGFQPNVAHGTFITENNSPLTNQQITQQLNVPNMDSRFVTYGMRWTPERLVIYADGTEYNWYDNPMGCQDQTWPFNEGFNLIVNFAIGGTWGGQQGVDNSIFPTSMLIKSINVWRWEGSSVGEVCANSNYYAVLNVTSLQDGKILRELLFNDPKMMTDLYATFQSEVALSLNLTTETRATVNAVLLKELTEDNVNSVLIVFNFSVSNLPPGPSTSAAFSQAMQAPRFLWRTVTMLVSLITGSIRINSFGECTTVCTVPTNMGTQSSVPTPTPWRTRILPDYAQNIHVPAVEYDFGGPTVAYWDNNTYNAYDHWGSNGFEIVDSFRNRPDWVDMTNNSGIVAQGESPFIVGYFVPGEFLQFSGFTVPVTKTLLEDEPRRTRNYLISIVCANDQAVDGLINVEWKKVPFAIDASNASWLDKSGQVIVPSYFSLTARQTYSWENFKESAPQTVELEEGETYMFRLTFPVPNYAMRYIYIAATAGPPEGAPSPTNEGFPKWAIAVIVIGGCVALAATLFVIKTLRGARMSKEGKKNRREYDEVKNMV